MRDEVGQENSSKEVRHKMKPGHGYAFLVASRLRMLWAEPGPPRRERHLQGSTRALRRAHRPRHREQPNSPPKAPGNEQAGWRSAGAGNKFLHLWRKYFPRLNEESIAKSRHTTSGLLALFAQINCLALHFCSNVCLWPHGAFRLPIMALKRPCGCAIVPKLALCSRLLRSSEQTEIGRTRATADSLPIQNESSADTR